MALAKVRYRQGEEHLEVVGLGKLVSTDAGLVANRDVLEPAGMTSLQAALRRYEYSWGSLHGDIHVTDEKESEIDDETQIDETSLVFKDGRLMAQAVVQAETQPDEQVIRSLAAPMLMREGMSVVEIYISEAKWGWLIWLTLEVPFRRRSVGDVLRRADLIAGIIAGAYPAEFDMTSAASVIRARHPELLVGVFESQWLDAKSSPYRLDQKDGQYELAKDVASFANANGGLILIGAKTKRRPAGDEINSVNGCILSDVAPSTLRSVVGKRIYPRTQGLRIEQIPLSSKDHGVVLIEIPRQAEAHKPFLAVGTKSGSQVSELGFTYAVREGEGTEAPRIEVIHQLIRAGKATLSGDLSRSEVKALQADIERLEAANFDGWISDIVAAAVRNGFNVAQDGDCVRFQKANGGPVVVQASAASPPADVLQRQNLLEELAEKGLPVKTTPRGFLQPILDSRI